MIEKVLVSRDSVMLMVEALSITIAQHSGGTPTLKELWAYEGDKPKLDIYYREAVNDLERALTGYLDTSSEKHDLTATGTDYTLNLKLSDAWATRLRGLLANKVQDYFVHYITASWLKDFPNLAVKEDYEAMSVQDAADILYIVGRKEFGFDESERGSDEEKADSSETVSAGSRADDTRKVSSSVVMSATSRGGDARKTSTSVVVTAVGRTSDSGKADVSAVVSAGVRGSDAAKVSAAYVVTAGARGGDIRKGESSNSAVAGSRNRDNAVVRHPHHCFVDWSGSGLRHPELPCSEHRRHKDVRRGMPQPVMVVWLTEDEYYGLSEIKENTYYIIKDEEGVMTDFDELRLLAFLTGLLAVAAVYCGVRLLWRRSGSCFGRGYWVDELPWLDSDSWTAPLSPPGRGEEKPPRKGKN